MNAIVPLMEAKKKEYTKFHLFFTLYVLHLHKYNHHQLLHTFPNTPHIHKYTTFTNTHTAQTHVYTISQPRLLCPVWVKSQKQTLISYSRFKRLYNIKAAMTKTAGVVISHSNCAGTVYIAVQGRFSR